MTEFEKKRRELWDITKRMNQSKGEEHEKLKEEHEKVWQEFDQLRKKKWREEEER